MPSAVFLATCTGSLGLAAAAPSWGAATEPGRWCRMRSSVSKQETALLLENCLPFHYRTIKLRSKSFTADKDPRYLLDKRAQVLLNLTGVITYCHLKFPLQIQSEPALAFAFQYPVSGCRVAVKQLLGSTLPNTKEWVFFVSWMLGRGCGMLASFHVGLVLAGRFTGIIINKEILALLNANSVLRK